MIPDDPVIALLADANPVPRAVPRGRNERADADEILVRVLGLPPPRRKRPPVLWPAISLLVVLAVVAVSIGVGGSGRREAPAAAGVRIVLEAAPSGQPPVVTGAVLSRTVQILRERLTSVFHD